jgi:hypothetical protein
VSSSAIGKYSNILSKLHDGFCRLFTKVKKAENEPELLMCSFFWNAEKAPDNLQLELTDTESDTPLKEKFNFVQCATFFGLLCDSKYTNFKDLERCYEFGHLHRAKN